MVLDAFTSFGLHTTLQSEMINLPTHTHTRSMNRTQFSAFNKIVQICLVQLNREFCTMMRGVLV